MNKKNINNNKNIQPKILIKFSFLPFLRLEIRNQIEMLQIFSSIKTAGYIYTSIWWEFSFNKYIRRALLDFLLEERRIERAEERGRGKRKWWTGDKREARWSRKETERELVVVGGLVGSIWGELGKCQCERKRDRARAVLFGDWLIG